MPKGRDREEGEPLIAAGDGDRASDEDEDWPAEDGVGAAATTTAASSASAEAGVGQAYEPAAHAAATGAPEAEDADDLDDLDDSAAARHPLLPAAASANSSSHRLVLGRSNNPSPLPDSASAPRSPGWGGGANSNYSSNAAHRGLPLELLELEDRSAANNNSSSSSNDPAGSGFDVLTMPSGRVVEVHHQGGAPAPGGAEVPVLGFISQVTPTLVVSGLGMIAAGVLLDVVQVRVVRGPLSLLPAVVLTPSLSSFFFFCFFCAACVCCSTGRCLWRSPSCLSWCRLCLGSRATWR